VVVADQRSPRDGRFIENIGKYHPLEDPSLIEIDEERALHWLRVGAQPSDQVRNLMVKVGIWERFVQERPGAAKLVRAPRPTTDEPKLSKKAQAKAAAEAEAAAAPAPEAEAPQEPVIDERTATLDEAPAAEAPAPEAEMTDEAPAPRAESNEAQTDEAAVTEEPAAEPAEEAEAEA
jgi:small subunit ribosomal protein S16